MKPTRARAKGAPRRTAREGVSLEVEPLFAPVAEALAGDGAVSPARMFGSTGLKVKGKVFAMLVKGTLVVKLPRARVDGLITSGTGRHFDPGHGRLMKEWVAVAPESRRLWPALALEAKAFVERAS